MRIVLKNNFHNTEVEVQVKLIDDKAWALSKYMVKKAKKALCGVERCTCAGESGVRGPNEYLIFLTQHGGAVVIRNGEI